MNMKEHILAAMREQLASWEKLLASLDEEQITAPTFDLNWSVKDVVTHLWAWQQISIARMQGGLDDQVPDHPKWIVESVENWEDAADRVNALTFERHRKAPWSEIYNQWKSGYVHFLELGSRISERDLLDGDRYPWLNGYNLASILIASYDHHQEHFEKLTRWLKEQ